ncbi:hypothetical protein NKH72_21925 [Mesorhizobium sp. M0955]|uniref:hypothetical protein n=1 Tax=Mesorhizobium sp. M0955 TaxID=2957033 RepID=UPI0033375694
MTIQNITDADGKLLGVRHTDPIYGGPAVLPDLVLDPPNVMNTVTPQAPDQLDRFGHERVGNYMHSASGYKYWPFDPKAEEVDIDTIAHQLAGQNRWQGAVRHRFYKSKIFLSVAEHSTYCARYIIEVLKRPDLALEALLHDASEAYIGDLIRPLKYSPEFRAPFLKVEEINENAIAKAFNLVYPFPKEIKLADEAVCTAESQQCIFRHPDERWGAVPFLDDTKIAPYEIEMLEPYPAKERFIIAYHDIIADRAKYRPLPDAFRV